MLAVLEWYRENLWPAVVEPVFDRVSDPIERIFGILDGYRQGLLATELPAGCPIGNLALELARQPSGGANSWPSNFTGWREVIEQCLAEVIRTDSPIRSTEGSSRCSCSPRWKAR